MKKILFILMLIPFISHCQGDGVWKGYNDNRKFNGLKLTGLSFTTYDTTNNKPLFKDANGIIVKGYWGWLVGSGGTGLSSLNGLTGSTQTFAVGTSGTDFAISSTGTAHTFNIPDASATARGLVTTTNQIWAGNKQFNGTVFTAGALNVQSVATFGSTSGNIQSFAQYPTNGNYEFTGLHNGVQTIGFNFHKNGITFYSRAASAARAYLFSNGTWVFGNGTLEDSSKASIKLNQTVANIGINVSPYGVVTLGNIPAGASTDRALSLVSAGGIISSVRGDQTLTVNTTDVGNVGSGEDDLMTYTIPAGQLSTNNDRIEFEGVYQFTGSNNKTLKSYFGSQLLTSIGPGTSVAFITIKGTIIRTGAATQKASITMVSSSATYTYNVDISTPSETLSGTVVIKSTGTATSDNDIVQKSFVVKFYSAP